MIQYRASHNHIRSPGVAGLICQKLTLRFRFMKRMPTGECPEGVAVGRARQQVWQKKL